MSYSDPEKQREAHRRWYLRNAEKRRAQQREYMRSMDPDERRAKRRGWKAQNSKNNKAKGLTAHGTEPRMPAIQQRAAERKRERDERAAAIRAARQAWIWWIKEGAPDSWIESWMKAAGKPPWLNPRLTRSQQKIVEYNHHQSFHDGEQIRLRGKKAEVRRLKREQMGDLTPALEALLREQAIGSPCTYCRATLDADNVTLDHVTPLTKGGQHDSSNVVPACRSCNSSKQDGVWPKRPEAT